MNIYMGIILAGASGSGVGSSVLGSVRVVHSSMDMLSFSVIVSVHGQILCDIHSLRVSSSP